MGAAGKGRDGPGLLNEEAASLEARPRHRKLKPGPGLSPHVVYADQRRRLRAATIDLVAERGYERVTVRALAKHAGVSTRTFYRHFADATDCLGFAVESTLESTLRRMADASSEAQGRDEAVRLAVASMMRHFSGHPDAASVALVEAFAGGPTVLTRMNAMIATIEGLFSELLNGAPESAAVSRRLVGGLLAGAMRVARKTTIAGRAEELPALAPEVSGWMLALVASPPGSGLGATPRGESHSDLHRESQPFPDSGRLGDGGIGDERERILRATLRLAASDGLPGLRIPRIRSVAGVSRRAFDSHFANVTECFLDAVEWLVRSAAARAQAWVERDAGWDRRTARLVLALCAQAARNGPLARLVFAGILDAGRDGLVRREQFLTIGAEWIQNDLARLATGPLVALEASVAAAWQIAYAEVAPEKTEHLPGLSPLLTHVILASVRTWEDTPVNGGRQSLP